MTNEILESDIELARSLMRQGMPAGEICAVLGRRGIPAARAEELVRALSEGRRVMADFSLGPGRRRSTADAPSGQPAIGEDSSVETRADADDRYRRDHWRTRSRPSPFSLSSPWFSAGLGIMGIVALAAVVYHRHQVHSEIRAEAAASAGSPAPGTNSMPRNGAAVQAPVVFQLDKRGLALNGRMLQPATMLADFTKMFGAPTRTNQVGVPARILYAYDQAGILIYCESAARAESVVLDFAGLDGSIGTTEPCRGFLAIQGRQIRGGTTASELAEIKELGLPPGKPSTGVLGASFGGFDLVFSWFSSPNQLSLLEIDFK